MLVELPLVRYALGWLRAHVATSGRVGLCHGDYRIGNFMLGPERRIVGVFDWELAHLSDPVEDIAYAGLPLFRGRSPLLSQLLAPDEFFARYEELTGLRVEADTFRFWTVLGLVKTIASFMRGRPRLRGGADPRPPARRDGPPGAAHAAAPRGGARARRGAMSGGTTIGQVLVEAAERWPDRIAVSFPDGARTYAELADAARRTARGLHALGVRPGEHVGVLMPNGPELVDAIFGVALAGGVLCPLNARYRATELAHVVARAEHVVLLTSDAIVDHVDYVPILHEALPGLAETGRSLAGARAPRRRAARRAAGARDAERSGARGARGERHRRGRRARDPRRGGGRPGARAHDLGHDCAPEGLRPHARRHRPRLTGGRGARAGHR